MLRLLLYRLKFTFIILPPERGYPKLELKLIYILDKILGDGISFFGMTLGVIQQ